MMLWHENTFHIAVPLCRESTGELYHSQIQVPCTKGQLFRALMSLLSAWLSLLTNNHVAGGMRRFDTHVMSL